MNDCLADGQKQIGTRTRMSATREQEAVLLVAHGSRRPAANQELRTLAEMVAARGQYPIVEVGYLELCEPSIPDGGRLCVQRGATRVLILPYFLSPGRHVVEDLSRFQQELATEFPATEFVLCPHLGLHPLMVDLVFARLAGSQVGINTTALPAP